MHDLKRDGGAYLSDYDDEIRQAKECFRCSADFERKIAKAKCERDSLKQQLAEANAEVDLNIELMRKQNAACAAMREALEAVQDSPVITGKDTKAVWLQVSSATGKSISKALSLDAGKDLLERVRKAEELLEYLRGRAEVVIENDKTCYDHHEPRPDGKNPREDGGTCWLTPKEIAKYMLLAIDAYLKGGGKDA